jgi:hypothetical protein
VGTRWCSIGVALARAPSISFYIFYWGIYMSTETAFNINDFRIGQSTVLPKLEKTKRHKSVYHTQTGKLFLKGPIPWEWLCLAGQCPGKAMQVAIALWLFAGLTKSRTIKLNLSRLINLGVTRDSARRGLSALEKEKLVAVERHPGRKPVVTILLKLKSTGKCGHSKKLNGNGKESGMKGGT